MFREDWDASEDTSVDVNPLYNKRKDPVLLFGKGHIGGVGREAQNAAFRKEILIIDTETDKYSISVALYTDSTAFSSWADSLEYKVQGPHEQDICH